MMLAQIEDPRTALQRHAVAAGDVDTLTEGGERDGDAGATEQVDGRDRFDFLKTFRQDCENGGHAPR